MEVRDYILGAESVGCPQFSLHFDPWSRQAGAVLREAPFLADVEVYGIPGHAWEERTVTALLDGCGMIDEVDPETASRRDMACFRASVWTHDVAAIPAVRWLAIPEPVPGGGVRAAPARTAAAVVDVPGSGVQAIKTLQYRVLIHLVRVEEEERQLVGGFRGGDGRGQSGPNEFGDGDGGRGGRAGEGSRRISRDLAWRRGVPDRRRGPGGFSSAASCGVSSSAPAPEKRLLLLVVGSPVPLTVQTACTSQRPGPALSGSTRTAPDKVALAAEAAKVSEAGQEKAAVASARSALVHGPVEKESLVVGDVATRESRELGVDRVVWSDAPETLPAADPEALEPMRERHVEEVGQVNRSFLSPSVSLQESASGVVADSAVGAGSDASSGGPTCMEKRAGEVGFRGRVEEYFCVSVSEAGQRDKAESVVPVSQLGGSSSAEAVDDLASGQASSGYTGPNSLMQMVPRGLAQQLEEVEGSPGGMDGTETQVVQQGRELGPEVEVVVPDQEKLELAKIKRFCSSILKALAPPLLSEFERTTGLRADAEPFTAAASHRTVPRELKPWF
jgi:hypothetical protein